MAIATQGTASNYLQRAPSPSGLADVVDLILDKGLVIDAYVRIAVIGIELITIDARIVIASVDTYLRFAEAGQPARPDADRARRSPGAAGEGRGEDDRRGDRGRRGRGHARQSRHPQGNEGRGGRGGSRRRGGRGTSDRIEEERQRVGGRETDGGERRDAVARPHERPAQGDGKKGARAARRRRGTRRQRLPRTEKRAHSRRRAKLLAGLLRERGAQRDRPRDNGAAEKEEPTRGHAAPRRARSAAAGAEKL